MEQGKKSISLDILIDIEADNQHKTLYEEYKEECGFHHTPLCI